MAYPSADLLATTLNNLGSRLIMNHAQTMPFMEQLFNKKQVNQEPNGGVYYQRDFIGGSPAKGKRITNGDEVATLTRKNQVKQFQLPSVRHFIPIFIPNIDLRRNEGKLGVIKLMKKYPEATVKEFWMDWEMWLLTGAYRDPNVSVIDSPDFDGACTLNGNYTGAANGLFSFADYGAQNAVVQGIAKQPTLGFAQQYGVVTSFAANGMAQVGKAYDAAAANSSSGPDLGFTDTVSFNNLVLFSGDTVKIDNTDKAVFGENSRYYLPYKKAKVYMAANLDPTNAAFNGSAGYSTSDITGGVLYFCTSDDWEVPYLEMSINANFDIVIPDQDGVVAHLAVDLQPICLRFNSQALVAGLRIP